jgi:Mg/Co/Ni transporter MgtE
VFWVGFYVGTVFGVAAAISIIVWFTDEKDR